MFTQQQLITAAAFIRAFATGYIAIVIALYLSQVGFTEAQIGIVVSLGLFGCAAGVVATTLLASSVPMRALMMGAGVISAVLGGAIAFCTNFAGVAALAFVSMLNGMGRDRSATLMLEQSVLPEMTTAENRTNAFAQFNLGQDIGHALGALAAALPELLIRAFHQSPQSAYQSSILAYGGMMLLSTALYLPIKAVGDIDSLPLHKISPEAKSVIMRISSLFALDGIGSGFITTALVSLFFVERFHADAGTLAVLYFVARIANALSHLASAWISNRIGLVNTMVFTHIPSSILLFFIPFAPNLWVAVALFLLRESLVEMDVPTRQSFIMAIVAPAERTASSGVTSLVRLFAWALGPLIAGPAMHRVDFAVPFIAAGVLKISYDVILYFQFRKLKPPEECGYRNR